MGAFRAKCFKQEVWVADNGMVSQKGSEATERVVVTIKGSVIEDWWVELVLNNIENLGRRVRESNSREEFVESGRVLDRWVSKNDALVCIMARKNVFHILCVEALCEQKTGEIRDEGTCEDV